MRFGQQIKRVRKSKNISQQALALKLKYLTQSQISKIEKGSRKATAFDLIEIAKALGVDVNELAVEDKKPSRGRKRGGFGNDRAHVYY